MDLIKAKGVKVVDVADELLETEFPASTKRESALLVLDEWEMVLASGGEAIVCW